MSETWAGPRLNRVGCFGRCKVCGKAVELRRLNENGVGHPFVAWVHMAKADHAAVLSPGLCDV